MHCPFCHFSHTKVVDSRLMHENNQTRRRRECVQCQERFTTYEMAALSWPRVIKRDKRRVSFQEEKLRTGILRALEKRPVGIKKIEAMINRIIRKVMSAGKREIASLQMGLWVMEELHELDEVAYIRFASVYHRFQGINEFQQEINRLIYYDKQKKRRCSDSAKKYSSC